MVDCGHGGNDNGAVGVHNVKEKDVTLQIGTLVASLLRTQGVEVIMTRTADTTMLPDQRTLQANKHNNACLLVSIHANFSSKHHTEGIETFCLDQSLFNTRYCSLDAWGKHFISDSVQERFKQGSLLAHAVHKSVLHYAKKKRLHVVDRSVKNAASQILVGTILPCALIEVGFLSHESEGMLLNNAEYQRLIAMGISNGILTYLA